MIGMSRQSGQVIAFEEHLAQSIADILTTPTGTRVMRRDYGSDLPQLIDAPINGETIVDFYQAIAEALDKWEPRFKLTRIEVEAASAGKLQLLLTGSTDDGVITLEVAA